MFSEYWKLIRAKLLLTASEILIAIALLGEAERRSLEGMQLAMAVVGGLLCYCAAVYLSYTHTMRRPGMLVLNKGLWHFIGEFLALATGCYLLTGTTTAPFVTAAGFGVGAIYASQVCCARASEWTSALTTGGRAIVCARDYNKIKALKGVLERQGYEVVVCRFAGSLIESMQESAVDLIVCEASWPDLDFARDRFQTACGPERVNWQVVDLSREPESPVRLAGARDAGKAS